MRSAEKRGRKDMINIGTWNELQVIRSKDFGIYLGEEVCPGVREVWKYAQWSLWKESLISTAFLLVFAPLIVRMLDVEDPVTAEYAVWGLRILSITQIFTCRLFLDSSYFILVKRISLLRVDRRDIFTGRGANSVEKPLLA